MRFDYYASTIEDDPKRVVDALGKLGHTLEPCHNLAKTTTTTRTATPSCTTRRARPAGSS